MNHQILQALVPGDLVYDVGANAGEKAIAFLNRDLTVVCVEPQPRMIQELKLRLGANPNCYIKPAGLGREHGKLTMSISTEHPTLSTIASHWQEGRFSHIEWDSKAEVDIITLDTLIKEFGIPRYCKIDVEGYESEVIAGLSQKIGIISYEFTNEFMEHALNNLLSLLKLGYTRFNLSLGESDQFHFQSWVPFYKISALLDASRGMQNLWGDIYAN